jgi:hypothetical protein
MVANNLEARIFLQVPNADRFVVASASKECAATPKGETVDWAGVSFELDCETISLNRCQRVVGASELYLRSLQGSLHRKISG